MEVWPPNRSFSSRGRCCLARRKNPRWVNSFQTHTHLHTLTNTLTLLHTLTLTLTYTHSLCSCPAETQFVLAVYLQGSGVSLNRHIKW